MVRSELDYDGGRRRTSNKLYVGHCVSFRFQFEVVSAVPVPVGDPPDPPALASTLSFFLTTTAKTTTKPMIGIAAKTPSRTWVRRLLAFNGSLSTVGSSAGESHKASLSSGSTPATLLAAKANGCSSFDVLLFGAFKEAAARDERSGRKAGVKPRKWTGGRGVSRLIKVVTRCGDWR